MSLFAMMATGVGLKAQEVTITLAPEWNWISYPNAEAMGIAAALGDVVPLEGDVIKSQYATSTYIRGSWRGGVTQFMPGRGYLYYSSRNEAVGFVFAQPTSNVVTTATPTDITGTRAVVGGTVTLGEGNHVFA